MTVKDTQFAALYDELLNLRAFKARVKALIETHREKEGQNNGPMHGNHDS
jgi:hypothetical protein